MRDLEEGYQTFKGVDNLFECGMRGAFKDLYPILVQYIQSIHTIKPQYFSLGLC